VNLSSLTITIITPPHSYSSRPARMKPDRFTVFRIEWVSLLLSSTPCVQRRMCTRQHHPRQAHGLYSTARLWYCDEVEMKSAMNITARIEQQPREERIQMRRRARPAWKKRRALTTNKHWWSIEWPCMCQWVVPPRLSEWRTYRHERHRDAHDCLTNHQNASSLANQHDLH